MRPEEVTVLPPDVGPPGGGAPGGGAPGGGGPEAFAVVRRVLPRGPFTELTLDVDGRTLRAFVTGGGPGRGTTVGIRLARALLFLDGRLRTATAATGGTAAAPDENDPSGAATDPDVSGPSGAAAVPDAGGPSGATAGPDIRESPVPDSAGTPR